jgi:ArsR family transcriptional regulator
MTELSEAERCAKLFQALSDPHRLRILQCLRDGRKNVGQLADLLKAEIVNVSHHLSVLKQAQLVVATKDGRFMWYTYHERLRVTAEAIRTQFVVSATTAFELPYSAEFMTVPLEAPPAKRSGRTPKSAD